MRIFGLTISRRDLERELSNAEQEADCWKSAALIRGNDIVGEPFSHGADYDIGLDHIGGTDGIPHFLRHVDETTSPADNAPGWFNYADDLYDDPNYAAENAEYFDVPGLKAGL